MAYFLLNNLTKKSNRKDYVKILLDSQTEDLHLNKEMDVQQYDAHNVKIEKKMTKNEIIMNLLQFLLAGTETVSTTMSYCIDMLVRHPDEMVKLQNEIDATFDPNLQVLVMLVFFYELMTIV